MKEEDKIQYFKITPNEFPDFIFYGKLTKINEEWWRILTTPQGGKVEISNIETFLNTDSFKAERIFDTEGIPKEQLDYWKLMDIN
jgi:hypothetical protein